METFIWSEEFEIGIEIIDQQHKTLVKIINELCAKAVDGEEVFDDEAIKIFKELEKYCAHHFADESREMIKSALCKEAIESHLDEHAFFIQRLRELARDFLARKEKSLLEIIEFLVRWLSQHILLYDKSLARQAKAIKNGIDAEEIWALERYTIKLQQDNTFIKSFQSIFEKLILQNANCS